MSAQHLWEIDHPYYCTTGNYFVPGNRWDEVHASYDSWAEFHADWGDTDHDMNLVFRWDWKRADPSDYEPDDDGVTRVPEDTLKVFWVLQRKAILRSTECAVTEADEPAVLAWLQDRARTITAIWEPISLTPAPNAGDDAAYASTRGEPGDGHEPEAAQDHGDQVGMTAAKFLGLLAGGSAGVSRRTEYALLDADDDPAPYRIAARDDREAALVAADSPGSRIVQRTVTTITTEWAEPGGGA